MNYYGFGRVMEAVKQTGREQNTLVLFMSDNGGAAEDPKRSIAGAQLGTRESNLTGSDKYV